jgi:hypothetical protein
MLRQEILYHLQETRKLEVYVVGGLAALYAWLCTAHAAKLVWYVGVLFPLLGALRAWASLRRIGEIAAYLRQLEGRFFTDPTGPEGWERHFARVSRGVMTRTAMAFWLGLLAVTLLAPTVLAGNCVVCAP